jgi:hypothetical protein
MVQNARDQGLALDEAKLSEYRGDPLGTIHNSFSFIYWFLGKVWRVIGKLPDPNPDSLPDASQCVDGSVYERMEKIPSYKPGNVPPDRKCLP